MPFTPFHMGPGLAIKAVGGRHVSLTVFGFSQVAMDIEPLVRILRGDGMLHGVTHTYAGAAVIALASVLLGRPICQRLLDYYWQPAVSSPFQRWLRGPQRISWSAAVAGALLGTFSHVVLDSIMHADLQPFAPFSAANGLLRLVSVDALHLGCFTAGLLGIVLFVPLYVLSRRKPGMPAAQPQPEQPQGRQP